MASDLRSWKTDVSCALLFSSVMALILTTIFLFITGVTSKNDNLGSPLEWKSLSFTFATTAVALGSAYLIAWLNVKLSGKEEVSLGDAIAWGWGTSLILSFAMIVPAIYLRASGAAVCIAAGINGFIISFMGVVGSKKLALNKGRITYWGDVFPSW